jgi:hypothetical protein
MPQYDFSSYYLNKDLSDVTIVITTNNFSRKSAKRQRCNDQGHHEELPGHGIVLANVSQFFKDEIERSHQSGIAKPQIDLRVEPDQVAAARALIHFVYRGCLPDNTNQHLLVNALLLSDTYDTPACASACLAALLSIPLRRLDWQTVQQVFSLSGWQLQRASFSLLAEQCLDRLNRDLGDLDAALSCNHMRHQLLDLPFEGFVRLLADSRTQASYESTVLVATHNWLIQHPGKCTKLCKQPRPAAIATASSVYHFWASRVNGAAAGCKEAWQSPLHHLLLYQHYVNTLDLIWKGTLVL